MILVLSCWGMGLWILIVDAAGFQTAGRVLYWCRLGPVNRHQALLVVVAVSFSHSPAEVNPSDFAAPDDEMAPSLRADVVNAGAYRQRLKRVHIPEWVSGPVQIHHQPVPHAAGAVDMQPRSQPPSVPTRNTPLAGSRSGTSSPAPTCPITRQARHSLPIPC